MCTTFLKVKPPIFSGGTVSPFIEIVTECNSLLSAYFTLLGDILKDELNLSFVESLREFLNLIEGNLLLLDLIGAMAIIPSYLRFTVEVFTTLNFLVGFSIIFSFFRDFVRLARYVLTLLTDSVLFLTLRFLPDLGSWIRLARAEERRTVLISFTID